MWKYLTSLKFTNHQILQENAPFNIIFLNLFIINKSFTLKIQINHIKN